MLTEEQERIVNALDKHVLVAAGAGSGKTKVLVDRYVRTLLENPGISPSNIVAVTYTKRAASEMRNRIKARLDERIASANEPTIKKRLLGFRLQIDSALIGTIHSLCDSILHTFPEEAEVDPAFDVLDTLDSRELIRVSVEEALLKLSETDKSVQQLLSRHETDHVVGWIVKTINQRTDFEAAYKRLPGLRAEELCNHAEKLMLVAQTICCDQLSKHDQFNSDLDFAGGFTSESIRNENLRTVLRTVHAANEELNNPTVPIAKKFGSIKEITRLKFTGVSKAGADAELQPRMKELRDWLVDYMKAIPEQLNEIDEESFALIPAFIASHKLALEIYKKAKQKLKVLDYYDQIECAHQLLKNQHSRARRYYNEHLKAVLVDEFQDTNIMQSEIVGYLVGPEARVLLIGDEKQSIYKFQGADLSVFNSWAQRFADNTETFEFNWKGERVLETLSRSFRGHPGLTIFINNIFQRVLNGYGFLHKYHAKYRELVAERKGNIEARSYLVHFNSDQDGEPAKLTAQGEAVAKWIQKMVETEMLIEDESGNFRSVKYSDFAVLLPQHSNFQQFEEAFSSFELPYASMGGKSFLSTQEIFDMENLLTFINCPINDQALFGILRSPFFGISDDVLQLLFNFGKDSQCTSLWKTLNGFSEHELDEKLHRTVEILNVLLDAVQQTGPPELLRQAMELTGYDVTILALPSGKRRSRNVWKFISMAYEQELLSVPQFLQRLEAARNARVEERAAPLDAGDSIKIMTIHSAKGLEFPVVVLACMDAPINPASGGSDSKLIFHPEYGIAFNVSQDKKKKGAYFELCHHLQGDLEAAEKRRLFYVAASRARDYLGIFMEDKFTGVECPQLWLLEEGLTSYETPLQGSPPQLRELRGAFGDAPYFSCFDVPEVTSPEVGLEVNIVPNGHDSSGTTDANLLISQLGIAIKANGRLIEPIASEHDKPPKIPDYWLRVTSSSPDYVNHELVLGTYFHNIMEYFAATKTKPEDRVLESLSRYLNGRATDFDLQTALVHEAQKMLPLFYESELYLLMMTARKLLYERTYLPFKDLGSTHSKRPDLLLQEADGKWRIVDYKTDEVNLSILKQEIANHRQQIMSYVVDVKSICNIDAPGYVYFARVGQLHEAK